MSWLVSCSSICRRGLGYQPGLRGLGFNSFYHDVNQSFSKSGDGGHRSYGGVLQCAQVEPSNRLRCLWQWEWMGKVEGHGKRLDWCPGIVETRGVGICIETWDL